MNDTPSPNGDARTEDFTIKGEDLVGKVTLFVIWGS